MRETAIDIKIDLSYSSFEDKIEIAQEYEELEEGQNKTHKEFEEINKDLISWILFCIEKVLSFAKIDRNKVDKNVEINLQFVKGELKKFSKKEHYSSNLCLF